MIFNKEYLEKNDQPILEQIEQQVKGGPPLIAADERTRKMYDQALLSGTPLSESVEISKQFFSNVAVSILTVENAKPHTIILYVHGGGYLVGSDECYVNFVSQIVAANGINAVIPDYSLSPENKFPVAFNELKEIYNDLHQHYSRVIVMGDSAGGGLALSLTQEVKEKPVATIVFSPWTDLTFSGDSYDYNKDKDFMITPEIINKGKIADLYTGENSADDSRISPLFGREKNTIPTLIHVGKNEALLDDSIAYAHEKDNVRLYIWNELFHIFPLFGMLKSSQQALLLTNEFINFYG